MVNSGIERILVKQAKGRSNPGSQLKNRVTISILMSSTSNEISSAADTLVEPVSVPTTEAPAKSRARSYNVPLTPVITIKPSKPWSPLNLRTLWSYRELLYFLIWRDIKVRYKQTALGALWAIIQPLIMMIIFTIFFSKLVRIPTDGIPSGLFYYAGLSLWMFFQTL